MMNQCTKTACCKGCLGGFIDRLRRKITNPYAWFFVLWLAGLCTVLSLSMLVKLFIYIVKKTVH